MKEKKKTTKKSNKALLICNVMRNVTSHTTYGLSQYRTQKGQGRQHKKFRHICAFRVHPFISDAPQSSTPKFSGSFFSVIFLDELLFQTM
ncbi:hypothetical protein HGM15179_010470 [Zosterops borbonicus]|uniref:Uncharacterized protein n=1 Tax=Zosterops borbonicus TaxID=364589 RepID=A0A8K1GF32_9PASS|nr:hypothetical protein HGM15179_010470 [Zosterops borbonicus]